MSFSTKNHKGRSVFAVPLDKHVQILFFASASDGAKWWSTKPEVHSWRAAGDVGAPASTSTAGASSSWEQSPRLTQLHVSSPIYSSPFWGVLSCWRSSTVFSLTLQRSCFTLMDLFLFLTNQPSSAEVTGAFPNCHFLYLESSKWNASRDSMSTFSSLGCRYYMFLFVFLNPSCNYVFM